VLGQVVSRLRLSKRLADIVIVIAPDDTGELVAECDRLGVKWSKHDPGKRDALAEYAEAAAKYKAGTIVRITSDCPCIDPWEMDGIIAFHAGERLDYIYNRCDSKPNGWTDGFDVEVFSATALFEAYHKATVSYDREHVTPWMRRNLSLRCTSAFPPQVKLPPNLMLSINTKEQYDFVYDLYSKLPDGFTTQDILDIIERR